MNKALLFSAALAGALLTAHGTRAEDTDASSMLDELAYRSLAAERKAAQVGDVLTVVVQEAATAIASVDLRAQRSFRIAGSGGSSNGSTHSANGSTATESDGSGRTQRSGRLLAQLSVRVTRVNDNGDLQVAGRQSLEINGQEQLITLSGVVRPRDITDGNVILSSRIADARIEFDGKGFVARQSRPGWIAWLLSFLGL